MAYWLVFWRSPDGDDLSGADAEIAAALRRGEWQRVPACDEVLDLRRDIIASDPDWTTMSLQPRPASELPHDRFLAIRFEDAPPEEQVRDLRYVAARNRLRTYGAED